jgi:3-hydroxybutyryl-CoA dehydrogenase
MGIEKICVVGSGFLGTQIGVLCSKFGYYVIMQDISSTSLNASQISLDEYLKQWIYNNAISEDTSKDIKNRVKYTDNLGEAVEKADIVIEAVVEKLEIKRKVFQKLDELCPPKVLLATNSSSIKVSDIEDVTNHPERVLNMHFYSYPWNRGVLEIMRGTYTSDEMFNLAKEFSQSIGVYPIVVLKESTGFVFNRVWRAIKKECLKVVDEGVANFEDVDRAWMSLYDTTIGPFGMMDRVGLDVVRDIENVYYKESGDESDKPPKILLDKIYRGELGVKTGKGFYAYPGPAYTDPGWLKGER